MISWVRFTAAVTIVANLKRNASRKVDLAVLAVDAIPAMTLVTAVIMKAITIAARARAPNANREDASTIHASQRSARRMRVQSSSLRRNSTAVTALAATQVNPPNQSALLLLRLSKRSLRKE
jgi:hypothetical protein